MLVHVLLLVHLLVLVLLLVHLARASVRDTPASPDPFGPLSLAAAHLL